MVSGGVWIERRFSGPPGFANGGVACGSFAALVGGTAEVTLRRPIPLERAMSARGNGDGRRVVEDDGVLLAEITPIDGDLGVDDVPVDVTAADAGAAEGRSAYYDDPVFPTCFTCGPERAEGDGLRLFPGPVTGRAVLAAPWTPGDSVTGTDGRVRPDVVWAALDCPSGLAATEDAGLSADTAILLGRMAADVAALPRAGDECRVLAWPGDRDGRKLAAFSALIGPDNTVLAIARTLWLTVPR